MNVVQRMGRQPDAAANAIEDARCDALARDERNEARYQREEARRDRDEHARAEAMSHRTDPELASIRANPRAPELGATLAEMRVICGGERGVLGRGDDWATCKVGGAAVFSCRLAGEQATRCDVFYEGADLPASRRRVESGLGSPPTSEAVNSSGFRVFRWELPDRLVSVAMFEHGVRVSYARVAAEP